MAISAPFCFSGWEIYPKNLSFSIFDADGDRFHDRLSKDAKRLFIDSKEKCEMHLRNYGAISGLCPVRFLFVLR